MSSDLEVRLRRLEHELLTAALQIEHTLPQQLGQAAQAIIGGGLGWGSTYWGGTPGVYTTGQCGVTLGATLQATVATGSAGNVNRVTFPLDWDGTLPGVAGPGGWRGCGVVHYPGPVNWVVAGHNPDGSIIWAAQGYHDEWAVDTPVRITLFPYPNSPIPQQTWYTLVDVLLASDPVSVEQQFYHQGVPVMGTVNLYLPQAGQCGADFTHVFNGGGIETCVPWSVSGTAYSPDQGEATWYGFPVGYDITNG